MNQHGRSDRSPNSLTIVKALSSARLSQNRVSTKENINMAIEDKPGAAAASAPKGEPTGKYTLNGWGQTEADFAFFDLAQDKVELKSDGWRTEKIADDPNAYEWWYFDIHNHDGTIITGNLSLQTAYGFLPRFGMPQAQSKIEVTRNNVYSMEIETVPMDQLTSATDSC